MPWFRNTLFVITADHTNDSMFEEYKNAFGYFSIPIIFYEPGAEIQGVKPGISQQTDILPTILSWLNYDGEYIAFGNNLLDESKQPFAFNTLGKTYNLYMKDHLIQTVDGKVTRMLDNNMSVDEPDLLVIRREP
jgi:phosphoglycerol transferase MdoB-like AlkP superfamily enzyme